jgi:small neutral amino acid transporter SnatA (MarC family)
MDSSRIQLLYLRIRNHCGRGDRKAVRVRERIVEFSVRLCFLVISETTLKPFIIPKHKLNKDNSQ